MTQDRNKNRPGYKKTKVGWIPEGWDCRKLSSLAEVQTGISKSSSRQLKDPVEVPYLRVANVQDGHLDLNEVKTIRIERGNLPRYALQDGDVLFTEGGDFDKLGRGTIWRQEIETCVHQNHIFAVRPRNEHLFSVFLAAMASGPVGRRYFQLASKQSTNLASVNSTQLKAFPIPLPPLPEQEKIAEILSTWDAAIEQTRKLIDAKKRRKKALMQQLLTGKLRLPGFGDRPWATCTLNNLVSQVKRRVEFDDEATYNLLSVKRRSEGVFFHESREGKTIKTKQMYLAKGSDFLISKMQIVHGASAVVPSEFDGYHISGSYIALRVKDEEKIVPSFLGWLSQTPYFYHLTYLASYGVHIEKMTFNLGLFLKSTIQIPADVTEQYAIANVLKTADKEINLLESELAAFERQKRGLMQKLLTGEVRTFPCCNPTEQANPESAAWGIGHEAQGEETKPEGGS